MNGFVHGWMPRDLLVGALALILIYWQSAIEGSLNVLRQAEKAGVKKFVVTSSMITVRNDPAVIGTAFRSERRSFLRSDLGSVTYFRLQIGIQ